ncbi:MAG: quinolinate synthase NadA [Peptococcaceae bacterium]|nr:quinolinate synthase NadA [Peptococcaceae bacterium]
MQDKERLTGEIRELKEKRRAVILSHVYQRPEVQDVADFVGDSLELSRKAAATDAEVIIFCGVHFMAESAAILSPDKVVVLPTLEAGCPMADMVDEIALARRKKELPGALVVAYVNTSAEVKAASDICCTSANAVKIVSSLPPDREILFIPDQNLGRWVRRQTGRPMHFWEGHCNTHDKLRPEDILEAKAAHPAAVVLAHPECRPEILDLADAVASTTGMLRYAKESPKREFIVATETGLLYPMRQACPDKEFYPAATRLVCPNMKRTTLDKVRDALTTLRPRVTVEPQVREKALAALARMLELS